MFLAQTEAELQAKLIDPLTEAIAAYGPLEMVRNLLLAMVFGLVLACIYRANHKRLGYEQDLSHTLVFTTLIIALILMVIGSNPARAFAALGTISVMRFRTSIPDPRDTSFLFAALAFGVAAGTSNIKMGALGLVVFAVLVWYMDLTNFGYLNSRNFLISFVVDDKADKGVYQYQLDASTQASTLLNETPDEREGYSILTYNIQLESADQTRGFLKGLKRSVGVSKVVIVQAHETVSL